MCLRLLNKLWRRTPLAGTDDCPLLDRARLVPVLTGLVAALPFVLPLAGCGPWLWLAGLERQGPYAPVVLLKTEQLERPVITFSDPVYRPAFWTSMDENDPAAGRAAGFFVTLATADPARTAFRLVDVQTGRSLMLFRLAGPATPYEQAAGAAPRVFNRAAYERLAEGAGVFWYTGAADGGHRFGLLVPESVLGPFVWLEMYTSTADDGTPINAARLELVRDFFYVAIIGDSIAWGNGLEEQDKFTALVMRTIERSLQRKVVWQRYAQSGARLVPTRGDSICLWSCSGEVPVASTSVMVQADLIERPERMNLVLLSGCINDVGLDTLLTPATTDDQLATLTERFCRDEMATLLFKLGRVAPQALLVVVGYYPIISEESDALALQIWDQTRGALDSEGGASVVAELAAQCDFFCRVAHASLRAAVQQLNDASGSTIAAFADPGFGPQNATFASDPWLWGLTSEAAFVRGLALNYDLFPEDPLRDFRLDNCLADYVKQETISCVYASVGHPNRRGARAYAEAVNACLRQLGVLPADGGVP